MLLCGKKQSTLRVFPVCSSASKVTHSCTMSSSALQLRFISKVEKKNIWQARWSDISLVGPTFIVLKSHAGQSGYSFSWNTCHPFWRQASSWTFRAGCYSYETYNNLDLILIMRIFENSKFPWRILGNPQHNCASVSWAHYRTLQWQKQHTLQTQFTVGISKKVLQIRAQRSQMIPNKI